MNDLIIKEEKPNLGRFDLNGKTLEELTAEEERLEGILKDLKKGNLSLRTSVTAWEAIQEKKMEEIKKAEINLNKIYEEIWSQRESFCSKLDKLNQEFGILSDWWTTQMSYVSDWESLKPREIRENEAKEEIENLHKEIEELKKELENLEKEKREKTIPVCLKDEKEGINEKELQKKLEDLEKKQSKETVDVCAPEGEKSSSAQQPSKNVEEDDPPDKETREKRVRFADCDDICPETLITPTNELFTIMDIEKMRLAKRRKASRNKNSQINKQTTTAKS